MAGGGGASLESRPTAPHSEWTTAASTSKLLFAVLTPTCRITPGQVPAPCVQLQAQTPAGQPLTANFQHFHHHSPPARNSHSTRWISSAAKASRPPDPRFRPSTPPHSIAIPRSHDPTIPRFAVTDSSPSRTMETPLIHPPRHPTDNGSPLSPRRSPFPRRHRPALRQEQICPVPTPPWRK